MGLVLSYGDGQTPLNDEEREGLLIKSVTTHGELDEHEQLNIEEAVAWIIQTKLSPQEILSERFIKTLHKKMLGQVWSWAGKFRKSEKNLGIRWINIETSLKSLLDDTQFWINNNTYPPDEVAIRFKHRLVSIHCFSNGNGRHSRIMADLIIESIFKMEVFSWSHSNMVKPNKTRKRYIAALRKADKGNITPLIRFARS